MRTLSRPMFNMGGPIKQGVMNGIREPHAGGGRAAALVGNPIYPRTGGREHHVWNFAVPAVRALATYALGTGGKKITQKAIQEGIKKGTTTASGTGIAAATPGWLKSAITRDPIFKGLKWTKEAIMGPTAKTWGKKLAQGIGTPTGLLSAGWLAKSFWPDGTPKDDGPPTGLNKAGGFPSAAVKEKATMSQAQKDAFAMAQRTKRVQKYLDMMGYDASKKTAIADALIDASKIVSDRGTLDLKNITGELINPVIQATSKRLDKPGQIREAVGLMATKAEIEKDLSAETDALAKTLTMKKIEQADRSLEQGFETDIRNLLLSARTPPGKKQLEQYARLTADKYGESFTMISDEKKKTATGETEAEKLQSLVTGDGIYMIGENLVRVIGGVPKHIV